MTFLCLWWMIMMVCLNVIPISFTVHRTPNTGSERRHKLSGSRSQIFLHCVWSLRICNKYIFFRGLLHHFSAIHHVKGIFRKYWCLHLRDCNYLKIHVFGNQHFCVRAKAYYSGGGILPKQANFIPSNHRHSTHKCKKCHTGV